MKGRRKPSKKKRARSQRREKKSLQPLRKHNNLPNYSVPGALAAALNEPIVKRVLHDAASLVRPRLSHEVAAKLREKYEAQAAAGILPKRRKCLSCGLYFRPRRLKHIYCKRRWTPDCKWVAWSETHPRVQVTARGGARRWERLRSERTA